MTRDRKISIGVIVLSLLLPWGRRALELAGQFFDLIQLGEWAVLARKLWGSMPAPLSYEWMLFVPASLGALYLVWDFMGRPNLLAGRSDQLSETVTYGEAFHYLMEETEQFSGEQHNSLLALEAAARAGQIRTFGQQCLNWDEWLTERIAKNVTDPFPLKFTGTWVPIDQSKWDHMHGPELGDAFRMKPSPRYLHSTFPRDADGVCYGYVRVSAADIRRVWPPMFTPEKLGRPDEAGKTEV